MATDGDAITIDDDYEHEDPDVEYILENALCTELNAYDDNDAHKLRDLYNSKLTNACACKEQAEITCCYDCKCDDWSYCDHGGNYLMNKYVEPAELVLANTRMCLPLFNECNADCTCDQTCLNRLVQFGPRKNLQIINSKTFKSKGLATTANIPKGAFICEYAGELVTKKIARKRMEDNEDTGNMNYILCLNELPEGAEEDPDLKKKCIKTIVDPSRKGNIGRYLNHSCDPNCEIISVRVNCPVPKICIFAKRAIIAGEELCFHYGGDQVYSGIPIQPTGRIICLCQSDDCEKFLPNDPF